MPVNPLLNKSRILFTVNDCPFCILYQAIEKINMELNWDKRIQVINCTKFHDFDLIDNPIISLFEKYINGAYPILFWEGEVIQGANTEEELIQFIITKSRKDFIFEKRNYYLDNSQCFFKKGLFGKKRVMCS